MTATLHPVTIQTKAGPMVLPSLWHGQHLAVHYVVRNDESIVRTKAGARYGITHLASGFSAGTVDGRKAQTVKLAKLWDATFGDLVGSGDSWRWRRTWIDDLQRVRGGEAPEGPILPDVPTSRDVGRAMMAAIGADAPTSDDPGSQETALGAAAACGRRVMLAARRIQWRGEFWTAPTDAELELWTFDSVCETPDGRTVEPDHPESWLSILGLI